MPERPSPDERLAAIHAQLVDAVENLVHSEAWATMLTIAARFPTYSPSNVLLIATQRPDATRVAGIRTWNSLGRRVTKGEHGIAILAPCIYRQLDDDTPAPPAADHAGPGEDAAEPARVLRGFKIVHVFDITQTDGDPVPDNTPELLLGDAPTGLWEHLAGLVRDDGYTLDRGGCPPGVNGYTDFTNRRVRVRDDVDPAQAVKTLAHELGHIRADHATRFPEYGSHPSCRGQAEVEAESIAYVVTTYAGMAADPYSVPYVAGWTDGAASTLREALTTIVLSARAMLPPGRTPAEAHGAARIVGVGSTRSAVLGPSSARGVGRQGDDAGHLARLDGGRRGREQPYGLAGITPRGQQRTPLSPPSAPATRDACAGACSAVKSTACPPRE